MEKQIEAIIRALTDMPEPEYFLRFLRSRVATQSPAQIAHEYRADLDAREQARLAHQAKLASTLSEYSKEEVLALLSGVSADIGSNETKASGEK